MREQKGKCKTEIQYSIHDKKYDFLKDEAAAVKQYGRLCILRSVFSQPPRLYFFDSNILMKTPLLNSTRQPETIYKIQIGNKNMQNSICNAQFKGNILVLGKTGCGKTYFAQKLGLNNFFGKIVKTE